MERWQWETGVWQTERQVRKGGGDKVTSGKISSSIKLTPKFTQRQTLQVHGPKTAVCHWQTELKRCLFKQCILTSYIHTHPHKYNTYIQCIIVSSRQPDSQHHHKMLEWSNANLSKFFLKLQFSLQPPSKKCGKTLAVRSGQLWLLFHTKPQIGSSRTTRTWIQLMWSFKLQRDNSSFQQLEAACYCSRWQRLPLGLPTPLPLLQIAGSTQRQNSMIEQEILNSNQVLFVCGQDKGLIQFLH